MSLIRIHGYLMIMILLLGTILSFSSGCASSNEAPCKRDKDCSKIEQCKDKKCIVRAPCRKKTDCLAKESCLNRRCLPKPRPQPKTECDKDADCSLKRCSTFGTCVACLVKDDCQEGEKCIGNECKSTFKEPSIDAGGEATTPEQGGYPDGCSDNSECKTDETCDLLTKTCKAKGAQKCTKDDECRGKLFCDGGKCVKGRRDCSSNASACQADFECRSGSCYPKICLSNADCEIGQICDSQFGLCKGGSVPKKCGSDADCKAGEKCNAVTSKCEKKQAGGCKSDSDCFGGQKCNLVTKQCEAKPSGNCSSDKDCAAPSGSCQSGKCKSCASQFSCPKGLQCVQHTGRCEAPKCKGNGDCAAPNGTCASGVCKSCVGSICPTGQACNKSSGACSQKKCSFDGDCRRDGHCSSSVCKKKECGFGASMKCPAGKSCYRYICLAGCRFSSDCASGQYCSRNKCIIRECGVSGKKCTLGKICRSYRCVNPPRRTCSGNAQCGRGGGCLNTGTGGYCYLTCQTSGQSCPSNSDCIKVSLQGGAYGHYCFYKASQKKAEACDWTDHRCLGGAPCLFNQPLDKYGKCFASCQVGSTTCSSSEICSEYTPSKGACLLKGIKKTGSLCQWATSRCDDNHFCLFRSRTAFGKCVPRCAKPGSRSTCLGSSSCKKIRSSNKYGICSP